MPSDDASTEATERSPLLQDEEQNGRPAQNGNHGASQDNTDTPLAEEPSTRKLLGIMSAMWLGSFFAALGMKCSNLVVSFVRSDRSFHSQIPPLSQRSQRQYLPSSTPSLFSLGSPLAISSRTPLVNHLVGNSQTYLAAARG